jgi:AcrR family transcriptional regulator
MMAAKRQRGTLTADRLLTAALEVWAAGGQHGLSVQAVTEASGVSQGSLYHHFGSLSGLASALWIRCNQEMGHAVLHRLRAASDAREGVHALVRACLDYAREQPEAARYVHTAVYADFLAENPDEVRQAKDAAWAEVEAWFAPRAAAGEIADLPQAVIHVLLFGPVSEAVRRSVQPSMTVEIDLDEAVEILPERIWRSLRPENRCPR